MLGQKGKAERKAQRAGASATPEAPFVVVKTHGNGQLEASLNQMHRDGFDLVQILAINASSTGSMPMGRDVVYKLRG